MSMQDRAKEMEARYRQDEELRFRVQSRRDYMFGEWLAAHFGLDGDEADAYARQIVAESLKMPGDEDIISKALADSESHGKTLAREDCVAKLQEFQATAFKELS